MLKLRSILIQYRILLYLLLPLVLLWTLSMAVRNRDYRYLLERLGFYRKPISPQRMWFHAASVGEVIAVMPLLQTMHERHPKQEFLLTTGTPTGAMVAESRLPERAMHAYLPLDYPGAVKRFLNHAQPRCAIIMETELWANLYYACHDRQIPITIINARLSDKTLKANAWMYRLYAETLSHVSKILARSEEDANGFMTIGATASKIKTIGNIKLAPIDVSNIQPLEDVHRPYVLAASTHDNEEEILAQAWVDNFPDRLLIIAPRHPNRSAKIEKALTKITHRLSIRSKNEPIRDETQIYLADTLGELQSLMKGADIVFIGGSLVPKGGHNIIEPARFGKVIMFGPYMENFIEETQFLICREAAIQVANIDILMERINYVFESSLYKTALEKNCLTMVNAGSEVISKYISAVEDPVKNFSANELKLP